MTSVSRQSFNLSGVFAGEVKPRSASSIRKSLQKDIPLKSLPSSIPVALPSQLPELKKRMELVKQSLFDPAFPPAGLKTSHGVAAHFLGSYFVKGMKMDGEELEGTNFASIAIRTIKALDIAAQSQRVTPEVQAYRNALLQILEVELVQEEIMKLIGPAPSSCQEQQDHWHQCAQLFSEWMIFRLSTLKEDEKLIMPGGWSKHGMIYEVTRKTSSEFKMRVFNTGGGLQYHPSVDEWCKKEHMQILSLTASSDAFLSRALWHAYYEMRCKSYPVENGEPYKFDEDHLYIWLSAIDLEIRNKAIEDASKPDALFRRDQVAGICGFEVILLLGKDYLSTTSKGDLYHCLRSILRETALCGYVDYLEDKQLLPKIGDSPPFKDKNSVYRQLGALQLLNEEVDKLRRETLRNIRKKHEQIQVVKKRSAFLRQLQERIDVRIEACHTALKECPFISKDFDTLFPITSLPNKSVQSLLTPPDTQVMKWKPPFIPVWPRDVRDVPDFFDQVLKRVNLLRGLDEEQFAAQKEKEAFHLLNWFYIAMPTVKSGYWEEMSVEAAANCLNSLALFNKEYLHLATRWGKELQPDQHFFHMQKVMSVCLKLCELDPVMDQYRFPFDYRDLFGLSNFTKNDVGCLFTTDPVADKQVEETLSYLQSKCSAKNRSGRLEIVVKRDDHQKSSQLRHVWKAIERDDQLKRNITRETVYDYNISHTGLPEEVVLPSALLLATALADPEQYPLSPGYKAVYLQIFIMRKFMLKSNKGCMAGLRLNRIKDRRLQDTDFTIKEHDPTPHIKALINRTVVSTFCPNATKKQTTSLMARTASEREMLKEMDTLIRDEGEYALFIRGMQCREDRKHQVYKALLFYSQNCQLLSDPVEQTRLMSLWFEPGVLIETLQKQKESFADLCAFVMRSYQVFQEDKGIGTSLFILRLTTQLQAYGHAAGISDALSTKKVPIFTQELRRAWKNAQKKPAKERAQEQYEIAREALAYYGRGGRVIGNDLIDFLRYHFFFREAKHPKTSDNPRLNVEAERGKTALTLHISQLTTPELTLLFSNVIALTSEDRDKVTWKLELAPETYVVVASSDGRYRIDLLRGNIYHNGKLCFLEIPDFLSEHADFKRLFPNPDLIEHLVVDYFSNTILVTFQYAGDECFIRVDDLNLKEKCIFLRKFGSENYWIYQPLKDEEMNPYIAPNTASWFDETTHSFAFRNEKGEVVCRGVPLPEEREKQKLFTLVNMRGEVLAASGGKTEVSKTFFEHLKAFDSNVQIWLKPDSKSAITHIDFPSYRLTLTIDEQGNIEAGGNLSGFRLSHNQHVKSLYQIVGGLVFENPVTEERRVLLPRNKMLPGEKRDDFAQPLHYKLPIDKTPQYCTFVVKEDEQLYSRAITDVLYLTLCYTHLGYYSQASDLLRTQAKKLAPFTASEIALLQMILAKDSAPEHSKAMLVRLRACALFLENQELETSSVQELLATPEGAVTNYMDELIVKEFRIYRAQCDMIAATEQLTDDEERLLFKAVQAQRKEALPAKTSSNAWLEVERPSYLENFSKSYNEIFGSIKLTGPNKLFIEKIPPIGWTQKLLQENFFHLYDIARSRDPQGCRQRQELAIWVLCARGGSGDCNFETGLLAAILRMSDADLQALPSHAEGMRKPTASLSSLYEKYRVDCNPYRYFPSISRPPKKKHVLTPRPDRYKALPLLPRLSNDISFLVNLHNFFVKKSASDVGDVNVGPLAAGNQDPFYRQSFTKMQQTIEEAMKSEKERAHYTIQRERLQALTSHLKHDLKDLAEQRREAETALLALASRFHPPITDPFADSEHDLQLQAKVQKPLTLKQLMLLFIRGDESAYKFANPYLTTAEIHKLYHDTAEWLLLKTRHQQLQRAFDLAAHEIEKAPPGDYRDALVQKLYHELATLRGYAPEKERVMLAYEAERNLRLRPSQIAQMNLLKDPSKNLCLEIIMGSGKSDVLIPYLALQSADAEHLTLIVMQDELIEVEVAKLKEYAQDMGQEEIRVNWRNATLDGLQKLKYSLERIKTQRGFVAASVREIHDFYINFLEHERRALKNPNEPTNKERRTLFWEIRELLTKKTIAYFDEVDSQLRCNFEVLKAIDDKQKLEKIDCQMMRALFDILVEEPQIVNHIYFNWSRRKKPSAQLYVPERDNARFVAVLSEALLKLPLAKWGVRFKLEDHGRILAFLRAPLGSAFELPTGLDAITMRALSHARKQIQTILPATLGNIYGQHYGIPPAKLGEKRRVLPVPYRGGGDPQLASQFASTDEQMVYTLMSYHIEAHTLAPEIWEIVQKLKITAHMQKRVTMCPLNETMAYKKYVQLFGKTLADTYPLDRFEPTHATLLAEAIAQDPKLINRFVFYQVFPSIHEHRVRLTSNGQTIARLFYRKKGLTGTLDQAKNQFHRDFEVFPDREIVGKTLLYLSRPSRQGVKAQPLIFKLNENPEALLEDLLTQTMQAGNPLPHAIIDAGGIFKGVRPSINMAKMLLKAARKRNPKIKRVVYYDRKRKTWRMLNHDSQKSIDYHPSKTEDKAARITYFDQKRCIGSNILQAPDAQALLLINDKTQAQEYIQAAWRMRGLADKQRVVTACSTEVRSIINTYKYPKQSQQKDKEISNEDLYAFVKHVEVIKQIEDNLKSIYQQIDATFVETILQILDQHRNTSDKNVCRACEELSEYLVTKVNDDPTLQYGASDRLEETSKVLKAYVQQRVDLIANWYQKYRRFISGSVHDLPFKQECDALIDRATKKGSNYLPTHLSQKISSMRSSAVEVQQEQSQLQEQQQEQNKNVARSSLLSQAQKEDNMPHLPWGDMTPEALEKEPFNATVEMQWLPVWERGDSEAAFQADMKDYRLECINRLKHPQAGKNPLITMTQALALTGKCASPGAILKPEFKDLFSEDLLVSFNAICTAETQPPFFGAQKPLSEWTLLIQDKQDKSRVQLVLLSRKEAEDLTNMLQKDDGRGLERRRYAIALFSPRKYALRYGTGFYQQGPDAIDTTPLFSASNSSELTHFEQLVLQAQFTMGETSLYTPGGLAYLSQWLSRTGAIKEKEDLFKNGFVSGSLQPYESSSLSRFFTQLKKKVSTSLQPQPAQPVPIHEQPTSAPITPTPVATPQPTLAPITPISSSTHQPFVQHSEQAQKESVGYLQRFCDFLRTLFAALLRILCCLSIRSSRQPPEKDVAEQAKPIKVLS